VDPATPALVLHAGHHGALGVARSLGRLGVPVYLVDSDPRAPAFRSRYCRGSCVWDIDRAPANDSVRYLSEISDKLRRRALLIATSDASALFLASNAEALRKGFLFPHFSPGGTGYLCNKKRMHFLAGSAGIPTVKTFFPESADDFRAFARGAAFPLIVKATEHGSPSNGSTRKKIIVRNRQEFLNSPKRISVPDVRNLMVQDYVPDEVGDIWMFNGYFNAQSQCLFGLAGRKIRQNPPEAGITSLGACLPNELVVDTSERFMRAIRYEGIVDIDYVFDVRDGLYKVIDVNPRLGCTFRLFVSDTGMDVVRALYLDLTGQPVTGGRNPASRKWMVEPLDIASAFRNWRRGKLPFTGWARSVRGLQEYAYFATDDPHPMWAMLVNCFRRNRVFAPGDR